MTARQTELAAVERTVAEGTEHICAVVESWAFATQEYLQNRAESTCRGRYQAEQQCAATITGLQPERGGKKQPERQETDRAQHPAEVVIVDIQLNDMCPRPSVAEMGRDDHHDGKQRDLYGRAHRSNIFGAMRLLPLIAVVVVASASAQDIPPYVPANPVLGSRSALYAQSFISPHAGWQTRFLVDYYNVIEVSQNAVVLPLRQSILDAEVLQADLWATRDISPKVFVVVNLPVRGGYDGAFDGVLNWYHKALGLRVPARDQQPKNVFEWSFVLPDSTVNRTKPGTFVGDVRAGIGWRFGRAQVVATLTLPTATLDDDGWTRHVIGGSVAITDDLVRTTRIVLNASASTGFTPTHGALAKYQRSVFAGGLVSARWRFAGEQAVFSTVWAQSGNWKNTGFTGMDNPEVSMDFGFLLRVGKRWPELQLGMTQDLVPRGPALDVGLTVGLRW